MITKFELMNEKHKALVREGEERIDSYLRRQFGYIQMESKYGPVIEFLKIRYQNAGWDVTLHTEYIPTAGPRSNKPPYALTIR
jgi:hypothetical protein